MEGKTMTSGAAWKHIIRFAFPVLLGSLLQQLYNTFDTIIVGKFQSENALSAVGTTGTITFFFLAVAIGFSTGNGVLVARNFGADDKDGVRMHAANGIMFLMALSIAGTVLGVALAKPVFSTLMAVPDEILTETLQYFRIYCLGLIFQYGYNILSSILRAIGDSAATLYFLLISSVTNVLLDLLFVAVFKWGVTGAAVATDIAQFGSLAAAYIYMIKKYDVFRFKSHDFRWNRDSIKKTVILGFPISLQLIIVSVGLTFIQRAVNEFGKTMTASFTVGNRVEQYINLPANAIQSTLATYTGQNIGAGKPDRVKKGAMQGEMISGIFTVFISALIWIFAKDIAGLFSLSEEALVYCVPHIRTVALINIILSLYVPLFGVYQGMGHSGFPTIVAICALTVRVTSVYLFRYTDFFGTSIIWWNGMFGFGTGFIVCWTYYLSGKWKKLKG